MKQSHLFGTTRKEAPAGEESKNAILLARGGYIDKEMAGVYTLLPLGLRVVEKIKTIIRAELDKLPHTSEIAMPILQSHALWEESGRREKIRDVMYDLKDEAIGLGPTHEEIVTDIFRRFYSSYKDLPKAAYQIQTKFRREPRAKSGLLRGREFLMKDLYSFHETEASLGEYYDLVKKSYFDIFTNLGLKSVLTEASGGVFSKYSHEFQVLSESGEDVIYLNQAGNLARNKEIVQENDPEFLEWAEGYVNKQSAIEVGNIFKLNRQFSDSMHASVSGKDGHSTNVWMGCYGIGVTRLVGTLVEIYGDLEKGSINWPESVAPYRVHLIEIGVGLGRDVYNMLVGANHDSPVKNDVLYDDRDAHAGTKFADADLIGAPIRLIVSARTLEQDSVELSRSNVIAESPELVERARRQSTLVKQSELIQALTK